MLESSLLETGSVGHSASEYSASEYSEIKSDEVGQNASCAAQICTQDTILIVDDNTTNLSLMYEFLMAQNYRVAVAQSGEDALECVLDTLPDLILLDVMMPGISGFDTCIRLKENYQTQQIPVIFMTALSEITSKVKGLTLGAVDYITKPFIQEEVLARIKVHLSLKKARAHLIQSGKMAALGHFVAGIAHEINNPVNFIHGNLKPARQYAESLLSFVEILQANVELPSTVSSYAEEIELDFIRQDFVPLLDSMRLGTERIRKLVESLRTFSCLDESEYKAVDLHPGIDSALVMVKYSLQARGTRPNIQIDKTYGSLPLLHCYPKRLNDAFLSLITNSIDSIDEKAAQVPFDYWRNCPPAIKIETMTQSHQVIVQITDNGLGISEDIQDKVFDQFFTTKPVGRNAGLGLSTALATVVRDHQGSLTFRSEVGRGTVFKVTLPIRR